MPEAKLPWIRTRREFLKSATVSVAAAVSAPTWMPAAAPSPESSLPWYRRTLRWGQTNITEADPPRYDIDWWRGQWRRTRIQGVIINAGGIVAYYPTQVPFHRRARFLGDRDLFGELCRAARAEGLTVLARMDSSRAHADLYEAHPDWFVVNSQGKPTATEGLYLACSNGPYFEKHLPAILREIIERYQPDGFADNAWHGAPRGLICHCRHCADRFRQRTGKDLPRQANWDDPLYRDWVRWNYDCRVELWDFNNRITRAAGGAQCLWVGMHAGDMARQCLTFRDSKRMCERAELLLLDHQSRSDVGGFAENSDLGKRLHGLLGWDKIIPEAQALHQGVSPLFRLSSKPAAEARLWCLAGLAGNLHPWWHQLGAWHEDRRAYDIVEPVNRWHAANARYLVHREPVASVGVLWSQENYDFYGRDDAELLVGMAWRGLTQALVRARIPYVPVHADHVEREGHRLAALVLPHLGVLSQAQALSIRRFVAGGGGLLVIGADCGLFTEQGEARNDFPLDDVLGAHLADASVVGDWASRRQRAAETQHTYLRLHPERRGSVPGPRGGNEPVSVDERHAALRGFDATDLLPFGGVLPELRLAQGVEVLATYVPPFPSNPPEFAWMRESHATIPALLAYQRPSWGRAAFLPADLDRRYARHSLPDHGDLLANLVRWVTAEQMPLRVEGKGLLDCHVYQQPGCLILHLVNLTHPAAWRQPLTEFIPTGPFGVRLRLVEGVRGRTVRSLVTGATIRCHRAHGHVEFEVRLIKDHEVLVIH